MTNQVGVRRHRPWLALILAGYIILGLAYSVVVPLGEAPDEVDHFLYIQHLAQTGRFPVLAPVAADNVTMEANQPPLFYLLGAAVTGWIEMAEPADFTLNACYSFDPNDPGRQTFYRHSPAEQFPYHGAFLAFHLARALSVLLGAGAVGLAYVLGRQLVPTDRRVGLLAAGLLAFNPQFIFITASVNNDVLTALLGAAIVVMSVAAAQRPSGRAYIALGTLIGLGLLTKFALLALWPLALLAAVWPQLPVKRFAKSFSDFKRLGKSLGDFKRFAQSFYNLVIVTGLPLLVAGWWYWRAYRLYGDPLAWAMHLQAKGEQVLRTGPFRPADLVEFGRFHFQSYWALFGWLNIAAPTWVYVLLALLTLAALAGLLLIIRDRRLTTPVTPSPCHPATLSPCHLVTLSPCHPATPSPIPFNTLAVLAIYISLLRYIQTINWSGYQGRLAYAVAAPVAALLALGLWRLFAGPGKTPTEPRTRPYTLSSLLLLFLSLFLFPLGSLLFLIAPAYPRPAVYMPGPDTAQVCARFPGWQLEGYEAPSRVQPGQSLPVTLHGYGLWDVSTAVAGVEVVGREGVVVGRQVVELTWPAGNAHQVTVAVPLTADARPARAVVRAGLIEPFTEQWSSAVSVNGRSLDVPVPLTTVKIEPATPLTADPQFPTTAVFGDELRLLGYDAEQVGRQLNITLYWQALTPMAQDYTTFVHLLDEAGGLVAQADGQPHEGWYPTTVWDVGEQVADAKTLSLLAAVGPFRLAVGVYRLPDGERLPLTTAPGDLLLLRYCPALDSCFQNP